MKFLLKILGIVGKLGITGGWKVVLNCLLIAAGVALLYWGVISGWNGLTYANKHYKNLAFENNDLLSKNISLGETLSRTYSTLDSTSRAKSADSLQFIKQVEEFQTLIRQLQGRNKATENRLKNREDYIAELESGLYCKTIKVGLFGKKTVSIAPCEDE